MTIIKPKWLGMLFRLFTVNYKGLWTNSLCDEKMHEANEFLWLTSLKDYSEEVIMLAAMEAIKAYHYPPSIQQFLEIAKAIFRNQKMDKDSRLLLSYEPAKSESAPASPLLVEYMRTHALPENDPFKMLCSRYKGTELGHKIIEEIKKKLKASQK